MSNKTNENLQRLIMRKLAAIIGALALAAAVPLTLLAVAA
jgi:hypothetical protein